MPLFVNPFTMEIPILIGRLHTVFFINNNLYVNNNECNSVPHSHHDFEIRYVSRGSCNQIINNQSFPVDAGNMVLIHPLEYHYQNSNNDSSQYNFRFSVIAPSGSEEPARQRAYENCLSILMGMRRLRDDTGVIHEYLNQLAQEIWNKSFGFNENMRSLCILIFVELLRLSGESLNRLFPPEDFHYRGVNRSKIDGFLAQNYLSDVSIGDLAKKMMISERQVNRHMHKMFGMSFTQKINDMRLETAVTMLTESKQPIQEISVRCGFKSSKYFYQCFKQKYGISPQKYRKNEGG